MRAALALPLVALCATLVTVATGPAYGHSQDHSSEKAPNSRSLTCDGVHVDEAAPVITRRNTVIHAPLRTIWKVQTDVENWPDWQPDVTSPTKDTPGRLRPGSVFRWKTQGLDITSTVKRVEQEKCLAWGGPAQGINAVHVWTFTPTGDGVLVGTEESWTGAPVVAETAALQTALDASLQNWLDNLEHESESRS